MEKTKAKEVVNIFRQLNPENQRSFMMMVRTADIAERNAGRTQDSNGENFKESNESEEDVPV